jgi:hypothetical protein
MTNRNAMFAKRQRELKQQEKAREKERRKAERGKVQGGEAAADGVDPDIAGIVPGPQPKDPSLEGDEAAEGEGDEAAEGEAAPVAAEKK